MNDLNEGMRSRPQFRLLDQIDQLKAEIRKLKADRENLIQEMISGKTQTCTTIFGKPYIDWFDLEADYAKLRDAIENAWHADNCASRAWVDSGKYVDGVWVDDDPKPCDCWKSKLEQE